MEKRRNLRTYIQQVAALCYGYNVFVQFHPLHINLADKWDLRCAHYVIQHKSAGEYTHAVLLVPAVAGLTRSPHGCPGRGRFCHSARSRPQSRGRRLPPTPIWYLRVVTTRKTVRSFLIIAWAHCTPYNTMFGNCAKYNIIVSSIEGSVMSTISPASHIYGLTTFRSDHHVALFPLVEGTNIWVWVNNSNECNMPHLTEAYISFLSMNARSCVVNPLVFRTVTMLQLVGQAWLSFFGLFAQHSFGDLLVE